MGRDLGYIVFAIIIGLAAIIMGASLKADYRSGLSCAPESPPLHARPAATKHFFRPGSGIGVSPSLTNSQN
jgi:hypothetical protein